MSLFSGKRGRLAAMAGADAIRQGQTQGNAALDTGYNQAAEQYGKAGALFGDLADSYAGGSKLYLDASGANGTEAAQAAQGQFTYSPAYSFNLDQGLQGLSRARAVNGTLASGNADTDAMKFASGLASNEYGNWLSNLGNIDTKRVQAVSGEAGTFGALGSGALGVGTAKAGLASQAASGIAQTYANAAKAGDDAESRKFGAIMGGANLVAKGLGSFTGGGGAFSIFGS